MTHLYLSHPGVRSLHPVSPCPPTQLPSLARLHHTASPCPAPRARALHTNLCLAPKGSPTAPYAQRLFVPAVRHGEPGPQRPWQRRRLRQGWQHHLLSRKWPFPSPNWCVPPDCASWPRPGHSGTQHLSMVGKGGLKKKGSVGKSSQRSSGHVQLPARQLRCWRQRRAAGPRVTCPSPANHIAINPAAGAGKPITAGLKSNAGQVPGSRFQPGAHGVASLPAPCLSQLHFTLTTTRRLR